MKATPHMKSEVEKHHINYRISGVLPESYSLGWLSAGNACKTGCWSYNSVTGKHEINVSIIAYDTLTKGTPHEGKRTQVPALYRNIYEHEAAHSLYSDKDLKSFADKLRAEKIPWRLCNLFEDCRIERRWFQSVRKYRSFGWTKWMPHPEPADFSKISATKLLFLMKNEGGSKRRCLGSAFHREFNTLPFYKVVYDFFYRIITAPSMEALIPILREWLKEFPASGDDTIEEEGGLGTGDLKESVVLSGGSTGNVKAANPKGNGASADQHEGPKPEGKSETPDEEGSYGVVHGQSGSPDTAVADASNKNERAEAKYSIRLSRMLESAFKSQGLLQAPRSAPSKRLNVRGLLRGDWSRPFIGNRYADNGKPHVSLIVDCSSSTHGRQAHIDREKVLPTVGVDACGRILVRALSALARRGKITATAYATAEGGLHRRVELPVKSAFEIAQFRGFSGSEGIGDVLKPSHAVFKEIASKGKLVICYTDGCITDTPIDQRALKERGLYTLGICCSKNDTSEEMSRHFEKHLIRESLWGLADALVRQLRTAAK